MLRKAEQTRSQQDLLKAAESIEELEDDHSSAGDLLKEMREVTADYRNGGRMRCSA